MKKYNITVNGTVYEVEVEEIGIVQAQVVVGTQITEKPIDVTKPVPEPAQVQEVASGSRPATIASQGARTVNAPMPGTILSVSAAPGTQVKAGDILLILEAMKMENEIMAPEDGTVDEVIAVKGAAVNAGDILVTLK